MKLLLPVFLLLGATARPSEVPLETSAARAPVVQAAPAADPALEFWIRTLAERVDDPDPRIAASAREGLHALGRPAAEVLARIAVQAGPERERSLRELAARIEHAPAFARERGGAPRPRPEREPGSAPHGGPDRAGPGRERKAEGLAGPPAGARPPLPRPLLDALHAALEDVELAPERRQEVHEVLRAHVQRAEALHDELRRDLVERMRSVLPETALCRFEAELRSLPPPPGTRGPQHGRGGGRPRPRGPGPGAPPSSEPPEHE